MKTILVVLLALALLSGISYITIKAHNGENILGAIGLRLLDVPNTDDPLLAKNGKEKGSVLAASDPNPTYSSTSPTVTPASGSASLTATPTNINTPIPTETLTNLSPTVIKQLPVSGVTDNVDKILFGGGALVLLGLLL